MTPAEQIQQETDTLTRQITDLVSAFEERTGTVVRGIELAEFLAGRYRPYGCPLNVLVLIDLPPEMKSQNRSKGAKCFPSDLCD